MKDQNAAARQLEWASAEFQTDLRGQQIADPLAASVGQLRSLSRDVELMFGRVVDGMPYVGTYKVLPERGLSVITCCHTPSGPNSAIGVRANSSIPAGARVWFIYHRNLHHGVIIAVMPDFGTRANLALSDYIYIGSRTGLHRDSAYSFPWRTKTRGIGDWSHGGSPFDGTTGGEWCMMSKTGLRVFVDDYMAQLSAGEACGVTCFIYDQLCRLAGINLQIRSNCYEWESLDDESELYDVLGRSVYPWESMGATKQGIGISEKFGPEQTEIKQPWYGAIEPIQPNQMPVRRRVEYYGYLGQGGKRIVQVPNAGGLWAYGSAPGLTSVFEENIALSGAYSLRSAKSMIWSKRPLIPKIYQKSRPEDAQGDKSENYKASSAFGSGPEHKITGNLKTDVTGDIEPHLVRHCGAPDLVSYIFNWEGVHPFWYHKRDWHVGEEGESDLGGQVPPPQFGTLRGHGKMYTPDPPTTSLNVDHRYNSVEYALTNTYLVFLEDGGVALADGYGSEIRMTGGHIHMTAPGDVYSKAGRNVVNWGGRDVLVRANRHAEISSTTKDVRIKAERHLWCLAGNGGGPGMLLLESRSSTSSYIFEGDDGPLIGEDAVAGGVAIRAPKSQAVTWAKDIYLRTGGGKVEKGSIVLDAAKGKSPIATNSSCVVNFFTPSKSSGLYLAYYDRTDDEGMDIDVKKAHGFASYFVLLDCYTAIRGDLAVDGRYFGNEWIYADNGHIMTSLAPEFNNLVPGLKPGSFKKFFEELKKDEEKFRDDLKEFYVKQFAQFYYEEFKAGNTQVMTIAEYSFRTSKQCGTLDGDKLSFRLFEDRWQQLDRMGSGAASKWHETWVNTQGVDTAPYPGAEAMQHREGYVQVELTIFQPASGTAKDRGNDEQVADCYANPKYGRPTPMALQDNYPILP